MKGDGMSSQGAFAASSGGESASSGSSSSANSSLAKSSAKVISSVSTSYSLTSYGSNFSNSGAEKPSPPSVSVGFNDQASEMAWLAHGNESLKDTTGHLVANRNEKSQALYAHTQNGKVILDRMANKANQGLHYDAMRHVSYNRTNQYNQFVQVHSHQTQQLHAKFDQRREWIRNSGVTLSGSFEKQAHEATKSPASTRANQPTKQHASGQKSIPPHMRENDRGRGR